MLFQERDSTIVIMTYDDRVAHNKRGEWTRKVE